MKRALATFFSLASFSVACAGCGSEPLTQLVVAVDTDLMSPSDLDRVELVVTDPEGTAESRTAVINGAGALPITLGIVHRSGPLGPVLVEARGILGTSVIVERRASVTMIEGRTLLLELHLESLCIGVACGDGETCATGTCRGVAIGADELRDFDGTVPRYDVDAGSGCLRAELCNGRDDTCDGMIDEGFDFDGDPNHCGGCGMACPGYSHGAPACSAGACTIACDEGWGDCDGEIRTGCEEDLTSPTMCGACGEVCSTPHATPSCFAASCEIDVCAPGYDDCDASPGNGCEMLLNNLSHCGACGRACTMDHATPSCAGGTCRVAACDPGWADCTAASGCETELGTLTDCSACGVACAAPANATAACVGGRCGVGTCMPGFGNCNGMSGDGCETSLSTLTDCGACGVPCMLPHATSSCGSSGCTIVACAPGYADCDGIDANGCEQSLEEASDCGACNNACTGSTPVCNELPGGERMCQSVCGAVLDLCGSSCVDLDESLLHCGGCNAACAPAHATGDCVSGSCQVLMCDAGWGDCDGNPANGCEQRLDTVGHCGMCGRACTVPGASAAGVCGSCAVAECNPMLADCDGMASNGCEVRLDTMTNCGMCGRACAPANATGTCTGGTCSVLMCNAGFGDCDAGAAGCETPLNTLLDCGGCGVSCDLPQATETCMSGTCSVMACDAGRADCTAAPGCETSITTLMNCGGCGVACGPFEHADASCATGACVPTCRPGYGNCDTSSPECETPLNTVTNCGGCGVACMAAGATTTCSTGTCEIVSCTAPTTADCNGSPFDGCEVNLQTSATHCGECGMPCDADETCVSGVCTAM